MFGFLHKNMFLFPNQNLSIPNIFFRRFLKHQKFLVLLFVYTSTVRQGITVPIVGIIFNYSEHKRNMRFILIEERREKLAYLKIFRTLQ